MIPAADHILTKAKCCSACGAVKYHKSSLLYNYSFWYSCAFAVLLSFSKYFPHPTCKVYILFVELFSLNLQLGRTVGFETTEKYVKRFGLDKLFVAYLNVGDLFCVNDVH